MSMNSTEHQSTYSGSEGQQPATPATERRISLASWVAANYSEADAPTANTVRRWVREKRIKPPPQKEGRAYFFSPSARYISSPQTT